MNNTETIGHKGIRKRSKLCSEGFALCIVLRSFCSVEANVLKKNDLTRLRGLNSSVCSFTDGIGSKSDLDAGQLSKAVRNGCERECGIDLALRTSKVGGNDHLCTCIQKKLDRRKCRANTTVIGNVLISIEGNIEVRTEQNALTGKITQAINCPHGNLLKLKKN